MRDACAATIGLALGFVAAFASADVVTRVDDERIAGRVVLVDSSASVVVQPEGGRPAVAIPAGEVLSIRFDAKAAEPKGDLVAPASGERLRVTVGAAGASAGALACEGAGSLRGTNSIPFGDLRAWMPPQEDPGKALEEALALENDRDVALMTSGDRLTGVVESLGADAVRFTAKLGATDIKRDLLRGIAFSKTLKPWREPVRLLAEVRLADGSVVLGDVSGPRDGVFSLRSVMGPEWTAAAGEVVEIRFRGGKLLWLSELAPAKAETTPFFNRAWPWRKDLSVWGNPLSAGGVVYERGLGTHSRTVLTWEIAAQFVTLLADVAIDDETKGTGASVVSVTGDGRVLLAPTPISGGDKPRRVKLDVTGVRALTLLVDFGRQEDAGDHVDWLNARLIRK